IPVVLVSAADPGEARAAALGAAARIQKPAPPAEVARQLRRHGAIPAEPTVLEALRLPELLRAVCLHAGLPLPPASESSARFVVRCGAEPPDFFARLLGEAFGEG